jgi:hypothetical protein
MLSIPLPMNGDGLTRGRCWWSSTLNHIETRLASETRCLSIYSRCILMVLLVIDDDRFTLVLYWSSNGKINGIMEISWCEFYETWSLVHRFRFPNLCLFCSPFFLEYHIYIDRYCNVFGHKMFYSDYGVGFKLMVEYMRFWHYCLCLNSSKFKKIMNN